LFSHVNILRPRDHTCPRVYLESKSSHQNFEPIEERYPLCGSVAGSLRSFATTQNNLDYQPITTNPGLVREKWLLWKVK